MPSNSNNPHNPNTNNGEAYLTNDAGQTQQPIEMPIGYSNWVSVYQQTPPDPQPEIPPTYTCEYCNNTLPNSNIRCSNCSGCEGCCECLHCSRCDSYVNSTCENCNRCYDCCRCLDEEETNEEDDMPDRVIQYQPNTLKFWPASLKEFKNNKSKRFISCELEFISATKDDGLSKVVDKWSSNIVRDGSLPDSTGFEINTSPAQGDVFIQQINELCKALHDSNAIVDQRCGFHVHIDATDYRYFELAKLMEFYVKIEPALFDMVPYSRKANRHCEACAHYCQKTYAKAYVPEKTLAQLVSQYTIRDKDGKLVINHSKAKKIYEQKKKGACKQAIVKSIYNTNTKDVATARKEKYGSTRYRALNIHSWFYRSTIEYRLGAGTRDVYKIINWSLLLAGILDYCYSNSLYHIKNVCKNNNPYQCLLLTTKHPEVIRFIEERTKKFKNCTTSSTGEDF